VPGTRIASLRPRNACSAVGIFDLIDLENMV
jgi:hypothetical protein